MPFKLGKMILFTCITTMLIIITATPSLSITRAFLLKNVFDALEIPAFTGKIQYSDVPASHPYAHYIETARKFGIIFPGERFHPDMEITRAEGIMFTFKAMGWHHEAGLAEHFSLTSALDIPPFIAPYLCLGKEVIPHIPEQMLNSPRTNMDENDLAALVRWIRQCRSRIIWHKEIQDNGFTLILHREGIGSSPASWSIFISEFERPDKAKAIQDILDQKGFRTYISNTGCAYSLFIGTFPDYVAAWKHLKDLPEGYAGSIVPTGNRNGHALFWTAIVSDTSEGQVSILTAPEIGGYKLPISHMAENAGAIAAVNGGYFTGKYPIGTLVSESFPLSLSYGHRSAVGWNSTGQIHFSSGAFKPFVKVLDRKLQISRINRAPSDNSTALFSRKWGTYGPALPPDSLEATIIDGKITQVRESSRSNHFLPHTGFVMAARGYSRNIFTDLGPDTPGSISLSWQDPEMKGSSNVIQGGPLLLKNGSVFAGNEGLSSAITQKRHPRTIVASDGKKMYWIIIDGRNSWHSSGLTMDETRRLLLDMNLTDALNLDGGGSSELWWKGRIINSLPGGRERHMPYCVIFK
jgi:hypothetical protein